MLLNVFARRQKFIFLLPSKLTFLTYGLAHRDSPDAVFKKLLKGFAAHVLGMPKPPPWITLAMQTEGWATGNSVRRIRRTLMRENLLNWNQTGSNNNHH